MADMPLYRRTRRWLLAGSGLLLPGLGFAQTISLPPADFAPENTDKATLTTRTDANRHLTIDVHINGTGPYRFVVDTGAERSVIADSVAAALNLPQGKPVTLEGLGGRITAPTVHVGSLSFGPFQREGLNLPTLPRANLFADGYLGLDAINGTRVTFDFRHRSLNIEQPRAVPTSDAPDMANVRAKGKNGRLRVFDCMVDSVVAVTFVDTGAEVSVGNLPLYNALKRRNRNLSSSVLMTLTSVTGGEVTGDVIPVDRIRLRDLSFTNGTLVIADVPDFSIWKLSQRPALLIGMDYLRQLAAVTIDYRSKEIQFEISLAPPRPTPGVEIEHTT
jgi:predicted aspartyl protease